MTLLNSFVKASEEIAGHMSAYYMTRDPAELQAALDLVEQSATALQAEIDTPALQDTRLSLTRMSTKTLLETVERDNAVVLGNTDYLADGPIQQGQFIRVSAQDQEINTVYLLKVTVADNDRVILAPVVVS
jgi:hypothetical protein